jgi:hypothetical protein
VNASEDNRNNPLRNGRSDLLQDATNTGFRNLVSLRNLAQAHAAFTVEQYRITVNQQRRTPNLPPFESRSPHARLHPFDDGLPLDLSYRANDYHHGSAKRASGIYAFPEAHKFHRKMIEFVEDFQEMANVPRYPVESSNEHNIETSSPRIGHQLVKAGSL